MNILKASFGLLTLLIIGLSTGVLTGHPESQSLINSIGNVVGINTNWLILAVAIPMAIVSLLVSAYFGGVMSAYVKVGDETGSGTEFGFKHIAIHPEVLTPAGLKARAEMTYWSLILIVALVGILFGTIHEVL